MQGENLSQNTHTHTCTLHTFFSVLDFVPPSSVGNNSAAVLNILPVSAAGSFVCLPCTQFKT